MHNMVVILTILIILLGIVIIKLIKQVLDREANPYKYETGATAEKEAPIKLKYFSGHPDVETRMNVYLLLNKSNIEIYKYPVIGNDTIMVATIPVVAVEEVIIKDYSTTDYETTTSRMIRFGDLGLALKTKVLNELADLLITWRKGKETYETCFTKKGEGAVAAITDVKEMLEERMGQH